MTKARLKPKAPPANWETAVDELRATLAGRRLISFSRDHQLQDLLATWDCLVFRPCRPARLPEAHTTWPRHGLLVWVAWNGWTVNLSSVADALGPTFPAADVIKRATALGLAYPNGMIHPAIEKWLDDEALRLASLMGDKKSSSAR